MPARLSAASISFPPPWIITTGAPASTIEATPATTAARLPRPSRSSPPSSRARGPADVAEVRVRDVLDFRERRSDQPYERRVLVRALEHIADRLLGRARRHADVDGREDAAVERHQVRCERHGASDALLDFSAVPV